MQYNKKSAMKEKIILGRVFLILLAGLTCFFLLYFTRPSRLGRERTLRYPKANVLLLTLDTTRPDRLGAYGCRTAVTPEFDAFARSGILFENAYSPVPLTLPSHASILTGTYPLYHGVRTNGKYVLAPQALTLAEILKASGYKTAAFVSSFILDSRFGLDQGFDIYSDRMDDTSLVKNLESERRASAVYEDFASWLGHYGGDSFFAWVHFFDPHAPYDPPEPYRLDPRLPDPYDGEIAYMDVHLGKIRSLLVEKGLLASTLIVLAGDHGEAFGEHRESGHTIFCYEENIRVPLVFAGPLPWPRGVSIKHCTSLIDILPTILDCLGMKVPAFVQGRSLLPLMEGRNLGQRDEYFESLYSQEVLGCAALQGILRGSFKFIRLPKPELYDLSSDPQEKVNLAESEPARTKEMIVTLEQSEKKWSSSGWASGRVVSPEEKNRLKSLGYLASAFRPNKASSFDPKDRIEFWNKSQLASQLRAEQKFEAAETLLLALLEEDPHFQPAVEDLAEIYFHQNNKKSLQALMEKAIALNPQSAGLRIIYGRFLVRLGMAGQAIPWLEEARALAYLDEVEHVYFTLGSAFGQLERYEEAVKCFRQVLDLEPENFEATRLLGYSLMRLGKFEEAIHYFMEAEKAMPEHPRLLEDMAMSLAELRRFDEAIRYFEKAIRANPTAVLYANHAFACAELGDYARAVELMEMAVAFPDADSDLKRLGRQKIEKWRSKK